MEAPLRALDPVLEACADWHGMSLSRNSHNWPERSLAWGAPIHRLIQLARRRGSSRAGRLTTSNPRWPDA